MSETDAAKRRFERALWELHTALHELTGQSANGPADCFIVFGTEYFRRLRQELINRPGIISYFTRPRRKKPDPNCFRWMRGGIQFGDVLAMADAATGVPFWPAPDRKANPPAEVSFNGPCPTGRGS